MRVMFASHTAQSGVFRVGSHHLAREFARAGHDVTHVSTPVSLLHLAKIREANMRLRFRAAATSPSKDAIGVHHVVPQIAAPPLRLRGAMGHVNMSHPAKGWGHLLRLREGPIDVLFVDQPQFADLLPILNPSMVVYRPTDAHFDAPTRALELRTLARSHAVVATSRSVLDEVTREHKDLPSLVLENGVEFDRFRLDGARTRRGAVYVGALDARFDWDALREMAVGAPSETFRIGGPRTESVPSNLPANVELLGAVPYDRVPELLASAAVGLLPLSDHPGNAGRSPMKFFEYLAAGLAVVATASEELSSRKAPGVSLYGGSVSASDAFRSARTAHGTLGDEGVEFARNFDWSKRMRLLESFVMDLRS